MNFVWSNKKGLSERTWKTTESCITTQNNELVIALTSTCAYRNRHPQKNWNPAERWVPHFWPVLPEVGLLTLSYVEQTMLTRQCGAGASPAAFDFVGVITYALVSKYWRTTNDGY